MRDEVERQAYERKACQEAEMRKAQSISPCPPDVATSGVNYASREQTVGEWLMSQVEVYEANARSLRELLDNLPKSYRDRPASHCRMRVPT
jgi:hypothetical protein